MEHSGHSLVFPPEQDRHGHGLVHGLVLEIGQWQGQGHGHGHGLGH